MCILLVEDERLILEIMAETLEDAGYDVLMAEHAAAALQLVDEHPCHFTALVSDVHMPGALTGIDVAGAVRAQYPGIPVVLATGRPDVMDGCWMRGENYLLLRKPYRPSELMAILRPLVEPSGAPR